MIINNDNYILNDNYFKILRVAEDFIEFQSKNTGHCWIIQEMQMGQYSYRLYHKHTLNTKYYHIHWHTYRFRDAVKSIKSHDEYVLNTNHQSKSQRELKQNRSVIA